MVLDSLSSSLSSPHRRSQNLGGPFSPSFKKQPSGRELEELGSWSNVFQRHRFLLTTLALLGFLCMIYLYFAVTLGAGKSCSALMGSEKELCQLEQAKTSFSMKGKLKFF